MIRRAPQLMGLESPSVINLVPRRLDLDSSVDIQYFIFLLIMRRYVKYFMAFSNGLQSQGSVMTISSRQIVDHIFLTSLASRK